MKMMFKMILYSLIPLVIFGAAAMFFSNTIVSKVVTSSIEKGLRGTAIAMSDTLANADDGDYGFGVDGDLLKGEFNISEHTELVDGIKKATDMDVTIFYGEIRYMTSILNKDGQRVIGTRASDAVVEKVLKQGQDVFNTDMDVVGKKYFGYCMPLVDNKTGENVGIIFTGMPKAQAQAQINIIVLITAVTIVVSVLIFCIVIGKMILGLEKCIKALDQVAQGKLNTEINPTVIKQKDEIGNMAKTVMKLQTDFASIIAAMKKQSEDIAESSDYLNEKTTTTENHVKQVDKAVEDIANGAGNQAEETQKATENIILMGNMIEETTDAINELTQNAEKIKVRGEEADSALKVLQDINTRAKNSIDVIYEQTNVTNVSAQKIKEATTIISSIAEETNLLSLNASIEAARAGEQGRGFAVVATQIQKLAEQSNESARRIESIILSLIEDSEKAVKTMDEVKTIMDQQNSQVHTTDTQVAEVLQEVDLAITAIGIVAAKTETVNRTRDGVVDIVQNLSAIAEENAASTQETTAAASEVSSIIGDITEKAASLKLISLQMEESMAKFEL